MPTVVCAILTSAYSDPIIKLSLRAGAVDCFFKNEAGELLLARIDALSRLVRQRKTLYSERLRLDRLVDTLAGATLLMDDTDRFSYVSQLAAKRLGYSDPGDLLGLKASAILNLETLRTAGTGRHISQWINAEQKTIDVDYRLIPLTGTAERMLNFKYATSTAQSAIESPPSLLMRPTAKPVASAAPPSVETPSINSEADPFLHQLIEYLLSLIHI